ncbi:MAG: hypothetical protein ACXWT0_05605 [Methylobacter sp.]
MTFIDGGKWFMKGALVFLSGLIGTNTPFLPFVKLYFNQKETSGNRQSISTA